MSDDTVRVTYPELARARGVTVMSAKRIALRHRWPKQIGNDGRTRVIVPVSALPAIVAPTVDPIVDPIDSPIVAPAVSRTVGPTCNTSLEKPISAPGDTVGPTVDPIIGLSGALTAATLAVTTLESA